MLKHLLALASASGGIPRLSILIFHRVLPAADPLFPEEIDAPRFDRICGWLRRWFQVLPLPQALASLANGTLPPGACAITFDDGYADNCEVALPILKAHGLSATFFISTGFLDGGRMWNDTIIESVRRTTRPQLDLSDLAGGTADEEAIVPTGSIVERQRAIEALIGRFKYLVPAERLAQAEKLSQMAKVRLPDDLMLTSSQLLDLHRAGMQIGAHTVSHPILARLEQAAQAAEINASKRFLETLLQERIGLFAYPNGKPGTDYNTKSIELARAAGFDAAVSTAWGAADKATDPFQLPRFTPWDRSALRFGLRMASNLVRKTPELALLNA
ncbi:MAG: polysaccharide deacetylase family protein [Burkholderiales bacterium]